MLYSNFQGKRLSQLALGCMRLPCRENGEIDIEATKEMVAYAMEKGVNYYDTAWGYHGGKSETVMGEVLENYPRSSFYLASKFPGYDLANLDKVEEIFQKQLQKCRVDYFDFYLFHNVCELNIDGYLDPKYGIYDYLIAQKKAGKIRHLGFSAHGNLDTMRRFLEAYGKDMEFCQLQINWIDWEFQNAKEKVALVASYGIPVWVMEPVRGGSLAKIEDKYEEQLRSLRQDTKTVEWAFRFLQAIPEVKVTLSGMSNFAQLQENIATFEEAKPVNEKEMTTLIKIARAMTGREQVPCTACRYCTDHCPMGLDIPWLIELYNEHTYSGGGFIPSMALGALPKEKLPSACLGCRACEAVCPQNIKISEIMTSFAEKTK